MGFCTVSHVRSCRGKKGSEFIVLFCSHIYLVASTFLFVLSIVKTVHQVGV